MRRHVAPFITALIAVMCLWAGSPHAATMVQLPGGGTDVRCSTVDGCLAATKWMLGIRSERELGNDRITILVPGRQGVGIEVNYRRGQSLRSWIASTGRSGETRYAATPRNATRYASHRAPVRTTARQLPPRAARPAAPLPRQTVALAATVAPVAAAQAAPAQVTTVEQKEVTSVETTSVPSVDAVAQLRLALQEAGRKIEGLQARVEKAEAAARAATANAEVLTPRLEAVEKEVQTLKATPPFGPVGLTTPWQRTTPALFWTGVALLAFVLLTFGLAILAIFHTYRTGSALRRPRVSEVPPTAAGTARPFTKRPVSIRRGMAIPFSLSDECIIERGDFDPTFDVIITEVDDRPIRPVGDRGAPARKILRGLAPWDIACATQVEPIEIAVETDSGIEYRTGRLTKMIADAARGKQGEQLDRVRAWLTDRELTIDPDSNTIVEHRGRQYAQAA